MKFFIDTANVEEIREAAAMGIIAGVTTNPSLIAKEGRDYMETLKEITTIVDGPISGEVKASTTSAEGMIEEGRAIAALHPNMVVKIPMTGEGLKAVKVLSKEGIHTNVTLVCSPAQALLAAKDTVAMEAVDRACHYLAIATGNMINTISPDIVVYGGGVIEACGEIFLEKILKEVDRYCMPSIRATVELKIAELGDDSNIYGALAMIEGK